MQIFKNILLILLTITVCVLAYHNISNQKLLSESKSPNDFPNYSKDELRQIGFEGTKQDVILELVEYSHLIPYESLSGEMEFIPEEAQILSHEWAFMPFGDGTTGGFLLLKFKHDNGYYPGNIEVVDSYLYGEGFSK